jgi:hypothetical protein
MPKLTRRQWNNILIFAVLILMFALYGIPQRLAQLKQSEQRLIPADSQLLSVAFSQNRLVQHSGRWHLQPAAGFTAAQIEQQALAWQHSILTPSAIVPSKDWVPIAQASVQLVGELSPLIWLLYPYEGGYLLQQVGHKALFAISPLQAQTLFLTEL